MVVDVASEKLALTGLRLRSKIGACRLEKALRELHCGPIPANQKKHDNMHVTWGFS